MFLQEQNKNQGQNISALDPFYKAIFDKSLILYTYEKINAVKGDFSNLIYLTRGYLSMLFSD